MCYILEVSEWPFIWLIRLSVFKIAPNNNNKIKQKRHVFACSGKNGLSTNDQR